MYKRKKGYKKSKGLWKGKTIGFKKRLSNQRKKSKKYNSFRVSRGGIRL
jgi:hypothetical protein